MASNSTDVIRLLNWDLLSSGVCLPNVGVIFKPKA